MHTLHYSFHSLQSSLIMETHFLTSNSFPKSTEFVPSIKPRITFQNPKRNSRNSPQFLPTNLRFPSSRTCCQLGSSPSGDDEIVAGNSDWRSFRAKLVAGEKLKEKSITDQNPIKIVEKWAHQIHSPEKGCLLIATEKLDGVHIFERTVILILSSGPVGPTGIILNRPSLMSIKEMRSTPALDIAGAFSDRQLYFGGPLEEGLFLVNPKGGNSEGVKKSGVFEEVMKDMYYGRKESIGCGDEMVKRDVIRVEDFRFYDGYCGWEKEQLNEEIRNGYWNVVACCSSVIGFDDCGGGSGGSGGSVGLWDEVIGLLGTKKVW